MLEAPFRLTRRLLPGMYERGFGRIVHISSVHGHRASPYKSAYVSAKHGLEGLSKVIALEGAAKGVTSQHRLPRLRPHPARRGPDRGPGRAPTASPRARSSTTSCSPAPPSSGWSSRRRWPTSSPTSAVPPPARSPAPSFFLDGGWSAA